MSAASLTADALLAEAKREGVSPDTLAMIRRLLDSIKWAIERDLARS